MKSGQVQANSSWAGGARPYLPEQLAHCQAVVHHEDEPSVRIALIAPPVWWSVVVEFGLFLQLCWILACCDMGEVVLVRLPHEQDMHVCMHAYVAHLGSFMSRTSAAV